MTVRRVMDCVVQLLRTAFIAALVAGSSVADDLPLRDVSPSIAGRFPVVEVELPTPWWRDAIQTPLGFAARTATITADEAVIQSLAQSPDIEIFGIQPQIERTEITRQQAAFDWNNFIRFANFHFKNTRSIK